MPLTNWTNEDLARMASKQLEAYKAEQAKLLELPPEVYYCRCCKVIEVVSPLDYCQACTEGIVEYLQRKYEDYFYSDQGN